MNMLFQKSEFAVSTKFLNKSKFKDLKKICKKNK